MLSRGVRVRCQQPLFAMHNKGRVSIVDACELSVPRQGRPDAAEVHARLNARNPQRDRFATAPVVLSS